MTAGATPPDPRAPEVPSGPASHNLLQQQLIAVKARLDRQVQQLIRLNEFSNHLLGSLQGRAMTETFAEAIVDVLDLPIGAVWVLAPHDESIRPAFAWFGPRVPGNRWALSGPGLAALLGTGARVRAARLGPEAAELLPGVALISPIACRCVGRDGRTVAIVLAADTPTVGGMSEPVTDETLGMLTVLAEKCAAHLDNTVDRRLIEEQLVQLRRSQEQLSLVLTGTNDGWWDWDMRTNRCSLSPRWLELAGEPHGEPRERDGFWTDRVHPQDAPNFSMLLEQAFSGEKSGIEAEISLRRADGGFVPVLVRGTVLRDAGGIAVRFAGSVQDLTERRRYEADIHQLAYFDPLTDLPNRRLLVDRLEQALRLRDRTGQLTAVLMLDVDRFKRLNDTHGHAAGDQLLKAISRRLRELVRPYDTVSRLGGDEFVIMLEQLGTERAAAVATAERTAAKLLVALDEPYTIDIGVTHHSVSVGVAMSTGDGDTADGLLKAADVALYAAKEAGRNIVRVFEPQMQQRVDRRAAMETTLREGFGRSELLMHYQAQVDAEGRVVGAEALMRWMRAGGEAPSPAEFVPVAEESGFIHELGRWSLVAVCEQLGRWQPRMPAGFRVAVNLSAAEFMHPDFPERVLDTLRWTGTPGSALRLEITEATVVTELGFAAERMHQLRAHDIEFSLDDFGSGYSSLTYLRRLPVHEVKIDQSYVQRILVDRHDAAIVRAILSMCESLNLRVVAEGIETEDVHRRLLQKGCRYFQGYLFGRGIPAPADPRDLADRPPAKPAG
jgi:diguanylate cyclase (GGDEF)-like protein/PAS domain S-box-containing protein